MKNYLIILMLIFNLTSCATYNSSFACGDAKGAKCISMDNVGRMIDSGEIERFNEYRTKCKGRQCQNIDDIALRQSFNNKYFHTHYLNGKEVKE